jgi:hypothetical protein
MNFVGPGDPPTLPEVLRLMISNNMDRGSFVRRKREDRHAGVIVLMLSNDAIGEVGPFLRNHASLLRDNTHQRFTITLDTPLHRCLEAMEQFEMEWTWSKLTVDGTTVLVFCIIGDSVTNSFAERLTKLGVITYLT